MSANILSWAIDKSTSGKKVGIASVITTSGSVPGKAGARLALTKDEIIGTVGGAGLEMKVIESLRDLLANSKQPCGKILTYGLNKRAKGYEVTALDSLCGGHVTIALEILIPMPHILLMGGGHCAKAIAAACVPLGWKFSVLDSRADYSVLEGAEECIHSLPVDFFMNEDSTSLNRFSDILLLGHDWAEDEERLHGLLFAGYEGRLGVIGSKSKWGAYVKSSLEAGISQAKLDEANCPIGLDIGAESPEEIAIATLAEIMSKFKTSLL